MMSQRRVFGLLAVAVAVIAVAVWLSASRRDGDTGTSVTGKPVLEGLKPVLNDVTEIRIAKGDGTHVTLHKRATDWAVGEREYTADSGKVRKLLLDLGSLQVVEEKTRDPASYSRIGVEDVNSPKAAGTRVEAVTPKKAYSLIVGKTAGMKSAYARVSGAPVSVLVAPPIAPEAEPKRWLDTAVLDVPEARIKEVAVKPATGPAYAVTREKKEQTDFSVSNVPKGRELSSPGSGNAVAGVLAGMTLDDVRHAPPGAAADTGATAKGAQSVTFRTFDGLELQVDGYKDGDRRYVAIAPRSTAKETATEAQTLETKLKGWQFELPGYKYDSLFRPLDELLKQPEGKDAKSGPNSRPGAQGVTTPFTMPPGFSPPTSEPPGS